MADSSAAVNPEVVKFGDRVTFPHEEARGLILVDPLGYNKGLLGRVPDTGAAGNTVSRTSHQTDAVGSGRETQQMHRVEHIEDAVFELQPTLTHMAKRKLLDELEKRGMVMFDESTATQVRRVKGQVGRSGQDLATLMKLAKEEEKRNRVTVLNARGSPVHFEEAFQLMHVKSQKFLYVDHQDLTDTQQGCIIALNDGEVAAAFEFRPRFWFQHAGSPVYADSKVIIHNIVTAMSLMVCNPGPDGTVEVGAARPKAGAGPAPPFSISVYRKIAAKQENEDAVLGGSWIRLYNRERASVLAAPGGAYSNPVLRPIAFNRAEDRFDLSSIFVIEHYDNMLGSPVDINDRYQLRHVLTNQFLAVGQEARQGSSRVESSVSAGTRDAVFTLVLNDDGEDESTIFSLEVVAQLSAVITKSTPFVLHHVGSRSNFTVMDEDEDAYDNDANEYQVRFLTGEEDVDTSNALFMVEVEDGIQSDVVLMQDSAREILRYLDEWRTGNVPAETMTNSIIGDLTNIVFLITEKSDNPDVFKRSGIPVVARQRVLMATITIPTLLELCQAHNSVMTTEQLIRNRNYVEHVSIVRLSYTIIKHVVKGVKAAGEEVQANSAALESELSCGLDGPAEVFLELFRSNPELVQHVNDTQLNMVVNSLRSVGKLPSYLRFLRSMMVIGGKGVKHNQDRIAWLLFKQHEEIVDLVDYRDGQIQVGAVVDASVGDRTWQPLDEWYSMRDRGTTDDSTSGMDFADYTTECMRIAAALCVGRNSYTTDVVRERYKFDLVFDIARDVTMPFDVRGAAIDILTSAYIDNTPHRGAAIMHGVHLLTNLKEEERKSAARAKEKNQAAGAGIDAIGGGGGSLAHRKKSSIGLGMIAQHVRARGRRNSSSLRRHLSLHGNDGHGIQRRRARGGGVAKRAEDDATRWLEVRMFVILNTYLGEPEMSIHQKDFALSVTRALRELVQLKFFDDEEINMLGPRILLLLVEGTANDAKTLISAESTLPIIQQKQALLQILRICLTVNVDRSIRTMMMSFTKDFTAQIRGGNGNETDGIMKRTMTRTTDTFMSLITGDGKYQPSPSMVKTLQKMTDIPLLKIDEVAEAMSRLVVYSDNALTREALEFLNERCSVATTISKTMHTGCLVLWPGGHEQVYKEANTAISELSRLCKVNLTADEERIACAKLKALTIIAQQSTVCQELLYHLKAVHVVNKILTLLPVRTLVENFKSARSKKGEEDGKTNGRSRRRSSAVNAKAVRSVNRSVSLRKIFSLCYSFLLAFANHRAKNKALLLEHVDLYLGHLPFGLGAVHCLRCIFEDDTTACAQVSAEQFDEIFNAIKVMHRGHGEEPAALLDLVRSLVQSKQRGILRNQLIAIERLDACPEVLDLLKRDSTKRNGNILMRHQTDEERDRIYFSLMHLTTSLINPAMPSTQLWFGGLVPFKSCVIQITNQELDMKLKMFWAKLTTDCFLDVERHPLLQRSDVVSPILKCMASFQRDLNPLVNVRGHEMQPHESQFVYFVAHFVEIAVVYHCEDILVNRRVSIFLELVETLLKVEVRSEYDGPFCHSMFSLCRELVESFDILSESSTSMIVVASKQQISSIKSRIKNLKGRSAHKGGMRSHYNVAQIMSASAQLMKRMSGLRRVDRQAMDKLQKSQKSSNNYISSARVKIDDDEEDVTVLDDKEHRFQMKVIKGLQVLGETYVECNALSGNESKKGLQKQVALFSGKLQSLGRETVKFVSMLQLPMSDHDSRVVANCLRIFIGICTQKRSVKQDREIKSELHSIGVTRMAFNLVANHEHHDLLFLALDLLIALLSTANDDVQEYISQFIKSRNSTSFLRALNHLVHSIVEYNSILNEIFIEKHTIRTFDKNVTADVMKTIVPPGYKHGHQPANILRLIQALCKYRRSGIQDVLRGNKDDIIQVNLVQATAVAFSSIVSGSIHLDNVDLCIECIKTMTKLCIGPCRENQLHIIMSDVPTHCQSILVMQFTPPEYLADGEREKLNSSVKALREATAGLIYALVEGVNSDKFGRILIKRLDVVSLGQIMRLESESPVPNQNIYMKVYHFLKTLADYDPGIKKAIAKLRSTPNDAPFVKFLAYIERRTAEVELLQDGIVYRYYFPRPSICSHLSQNTKTRTLESLDRRTAQTKLQSFTSHFPKLMEELKQIDRLKQLPGPLKVVVYVNRFENSLLLLQFVAAIVVQAINLVTLALADKKIDGVEYSWGHLADLYAGGSCEDPLAQGYPGAAAINGDTTCAAWWESLDIGNSETTNGVVSASSRGIGEGSVRDGIVIVFQGVIVAVSGIGLLLHMLQYHTSHLRLAKDRFSTRVRFASESGWIGTQFAALMLNPYMRTLLHAYVALTDRRLLNHLANVVMALCGIFIGPYFFLWHCFVIIQLSKVLRSVVASVASNYKELSLTLFLGISISHVMGILAFFYFREFYVNTKWDNKIICKSLTQCTLVTFSGGLRKKDLGWILDTQQSEWWGGSGIFVLQATYWVLFVVFFNNIILAIVLETFRSQRKHDMDIKKNIHDFTMISNLDRKTADRLGSGFDNMNEKEQNPWDYLSLYIHLRSKEPELYTGPEHYVADSFFAAKPDIRFYPIGKSVSIHNLRVGKAQSTDKALGNFTSIAELLKIIRSSVNDGPVGRASETMKELQSNLIRHVERVRQALSEIR